MDSPHGAEAAGNEVPSTPQGGLEVHPSVRPCPIGEFVSLISLEYRYAHVNAAHAAAHHFTVSDLLNKSVPDIWGQETFEEVIRPNLDHCFAGNVVHYQAWFDFPMTGRRFWEVSYYPYREEGTEITHAMVITRDLTEQKHSSDLLLIETTVLDLIARNATLGEVFARLRDLVEAALPGSLHIAFAHDPASGRLKLLTAPEFILNCNDGIDDLEPSHETGSCGNAALLGVPVSVGDCLSDPRWSRLRTFARRFSITSSISLPFHDDSGALLGTVAAYYTFGKEPDPFNHEVLAVARNLARVAIERDRGEQERRRLAATVENSVDAILIVDLAGKVQYVNPAFETLTGHSRTDFTGRRLFDLFAPQERKRMEDRFREVGLRGDAWTERVQCIRKDGSLYLGQSTLFAVAPVDHAQACAVMVQRDITEQERMETQLRHAQKLEAVGQLAGGVAHDFNNLLQVILSHAELSIEELGADHEVSEGLRQVLKCADRGTTLVRQLLAFSRREILHPKPLDLNDVLRGVLKMIRRLIGEHIDLEVLEGSDLRRVNADPSQMEQILINLCVNARDAMPDGGKIVIRTANVGPETVSRSGRGRALGQESVLLSVSDTGVGMSADVKERIFEPFFTTKGVGKGTGLGLATVYGIVVQHHGAIEVESRPGTGSTFEVYLPAIDSEPEDFAEPPLTGAPQAHGGTVLLAEDDADVRDLMVRILEHEGYRVLVACDGQEAIELARAQSASIDLALLDMIMPRMGGKRVLEHLRRYGLRIPVVLCTGYHNEQSEFEEGVTLLQKPVTPKALRATLSGILASGGR
ncbi:MAG: Sensor histidine kinase RcsC [bacterium]|nr:Sensor histidine kinase RcsC [bacterium]